MISFVTLAPRGPAQVVHSSKRDRYETFMGDETATAKSASKSQSPDSLPSPSVRASRTTLGKRKTGTEDEVTYNSSIQKSLARKKKRTLWDDSRSRDTVNDLAPRSTSSKQFNGLHIEVPPGTYLLQCWFAAAAPTPQSKVAVINPKTVSKSNSALTISPPVACGHSIHPAYKNVYDKAMCPMCLAEASMNGLQSMQDRINDLGGMSGWQRIQNKYHCKAYEWMPTSSKEKEEKRKKKRPAYTDATGTNASYRYRKA
ncbi:hypothetical protein G6011_02469 [Alternaria panax]|uniref:Uncharacterized protein n=1 Tax=Alternaria panax TaxID=48097 RepID=A0AAD4I900_9PLEO|nr:hypothetical protein G6011_02469 [Alternaria panax]